MAKIVPKNNEALHQCPECGLKYKNKKIADACAAWCKKNKTCNLEIIKNAVENQ